MAKQERASWPRTADAMLNELARIRLTRLTVGDSTTRVRVEDDDRIRKLLATIGGNRLLQDIPSHLVVEDDSQAA